MFERQALYRKHRPQTFSDLVGQEHIARTLGNAITHGKIAHAYLFTGPRGTGKTSSARILAKALNCEKGPTPSPCVVRRDDPASLEAACPACKGITEGAFVDVIEIDAASNNGVDDARDLREKVRFAPVAGRYKVYIIDEVHMLSNAAFNALLKTIEEPPANLVFILATTDIHKVLPTVISRCQRFDFQRIPFSFLVDHLERVATEEKVSVARSGIEAIAKRADGGLRDALSLLDQVISTGSETISAEEVFDSLGLMSSDAVLGLGQALAEGQSAEAISRIQALLARGYDHHAVLRECMELFRHLMLLQLAGDRAAALEVPSWLMEGLKPLSERFTASEVLYALEVLRETETVLKGSQQMTIWLEAAVVRLANRDEIPSIKTLTERVAQLEERMASMAQGGIRPVAREVATGAASPRPVQPPVSRPSEPASPPPVSATQAPAPEVSMPAAQPAAAAPSVVPGGLDVLSKVIDAVNRVHRSTGSLLAQHGVFAKFEAEVVTLGIKPTVKMFFEKQDRRAYIEKAVRQALGTHVKIQLTFDAPAPTPTVRPPAEPSAPSAVSPEPVWPAQVQPPEPTSPEPTQGDSPLGLSPSDPEPWPDEPSETTEDLSVPVPLAAVLAERMPVPAAGDDVVGKTAEIFSGRIIDPLS